MPTRPRVYLADPDSTFRSAAARTLRDAGIDVVEFTSAEQLEARALADEPDLVLLANGRAGMEGQQVLARLRSPIHPRSSPLVLVTDRTQPFDSLAASVASLLQDWNRLAVHTVSSVVTWLQTRGKSGRLEMEALGARGTVLLQDGNIAQASWKELRDRDVLVFFAEKFPNAGFRFAERIPRPPLQANGRAGSLDERAAPASLASPSPVTRAIPDLDRLLEGRPALGSERFQAEVHLELARTCLARGGWAEAFVHLRLAEGLSAPRERVQALLGVAHLRTGDVQAALQELCNALRVDPLDDVAGSALREAVAALRALPSPEAKSPVERSVGRPGTSAADGTREPDASPLEEPGRRAPSRGASEAGASLAPSAGGAATPDEPAGAVIPAGPRILTRALLRRTSLKADGSPPPAPPAAAPSVSLEQVAPGLPPAAAAAPTDPLAAPRAVAAKPDAAIQGPPAEAGLPDLRDEAPFAATRADEKPPATASIPEKQARPVSPMPRYVPHFPHSDQPAGAPRRWAPPRGAAYAAAAAAVAAATFVLTSDRGSRDGGSALSTAATARVGQRVALASQVAEAPQAPAPLAGRPSQRAGAGLARVRFRPPDDSSTPPPGAPAVASGEGAAPRSIDPATSADDASPPAGAAEPQVETAGATPAVRQTAAPAPPPELAAAPSPTLEELRSGPRSIPLTRMPSPQRVLDPRTARALIEPSRQLAIVRQWAVPEDPLRPATVWVLVDASGQVQDARVLTSSGDGRFDATALRAVRSVGYHPARRGDVAVPAWVRQRVTLRDE